MALQLLVQLPDEDTLHRLLDAPILNEVAHENGVYAFVIRDGAVEPVLTPERT